MAKITKMPAMKIVAGFKGILDYYVHDGQACVRAWPRSPGPRRAPAVEAAWPAFTWAAKNWFSLSPDVRDAYTQMATGTYMTPRDIFIKSFITAKGFILEDV